MPSSAGAVQLRLIDVSVVPVTVNPVGAGAFTGAFATAVTWFDQSLSVPCPRLDPTAYRYSVPVVRPLCVYEVFVPPSTQTSHVGVQAVCPSSQEYTL